MSSEISCIGYEKSFEILNLKWFKNYRKVYELIKIMVILEELKKGYKLQRWNKPTKQGTKARFMAMKKAEEVEQEINKLNNYIESINKDLGFDINKYGEVEIEIETKSKKDS